MEKLAELNMMKVKNQQKLIEKLEKDRDLKKVESTAKLIEILDV